MLEKFKEEKKTYILKEIEIFKNLTLLILFGNAPCSSNSFTIKTWPCCAAECSGVNISCKEQNEP